MIDKYRETPDRPALDPTLEGELRKDYVSADKMGQVVAQLRKEAPDTFDVAGQMGRKLSVYLWMSLKIQRRAGSLRNEAREYLQYLTS